MSLNETSTAVNDKEIKDPNKVLPKRRQGKTPQYVESPLQSQEAVDVYDR